MTRHQYPKEFIERLKSIKSKRPKTVIGHILKYGHITTEELESTYGYKHPPRAARDVRELGIPLETFSVKNKDGRTIAAYRFGDISKIRYGVLDGRKIFPKEFKEQLLDETGARCFICLQVYEDRYLQIDHRVPYEVAGHSSEVELNKREYMLLCGSCNRAKSWSCEHCANWLDDKLSHVCLACYWGQPEDYMHIALHEIRRLDVVWDEDDVRLYEKLKARAHLLQKPLPDYVKSIIRLELEQDKDA